jgi:hypothetical protein
MRRMGHWWYEKDGVATGPVDNNGLRQLLLTGELTRDALVWRTGMSEWQSAAAITEFAELPPPLPDRATPVRTHETDIAEVTAPKVVAELRETTQQNTHMAHLVDTAIPTPWRRFFTRTFDLGLASLLISFIFIYIIRNDYIALSQPVVTAFGLLLLPTALFIDAAITGLFGTTIGKALLCIKVRKNDGESLSFTDAIERNVYVLFSGLAIGIPLITIISQAYQFNRLTKKHSTSYDDGRYIVSAGLKYDGVSFSILCFGVIFLYSLL